MKSYEVEHLAKAISAAATAARERRDVPDDGPCNVCTLRIPVFRFREDQFRQVKELCPGVSLSLDCDIRGNARHIVMHIAEGQADRPKKMVEAAEAILRGHSIPANVKCTED